MPVWLKQKLFLEYFLCKEFVQFGVLDSTKAVPLILFGEHHESHAAAAAFFPSPYQDAAVVCMDGVGSG